MLLRGLGISTAPTPERSTADNSLAGSQTDSLGLAAALGAQSRLAEGEENPMLASCEW